MKHEANTAAIEAFARGCMTALLGTTVPAGSEDAVSFPPRSRRRSRPRSGANHPTASSSTAPRQTAMAFRDDVKLDEIGEPIAAPGATSDDMPAPPLTQAQLEAMERVLRGEVPAGYYRPSEGVAPWMES